ncbi:MAG: cytochrome c3 family protein [bacterium]
MKKAVVAIFLGVLLVGGVSWLQAEEKAPEVKDTFEINSPETCFKDGKKTKVPPKSKLVTLTHKKHSDYATCKECHHNMKDDKDLKNANKCSTADCHGAEPHGENNKIIDLKSAMHDNCYKGCHKTNEKAVEKKAPTKCNECHAKNE